MIENESVIIRTFTDTLKGHLFVGADGLPELAVESGRHHPASYRPATLPAAWTLVTDRALPGVLLNAWRDIDTLRQEIAAAAHEAAREEPQDPDDIDAYKRDAAAGGER